MGEKWKQREKERKNILKLEQQEKKKRQGEDKNPLAERTMAETSKDGSKKEGEAKTKKVERKRGCYWRKRARVRQRASGTLEGHWDKEKERMTVKNRMEHANSKGAKDTH